jgi:hypothetical protein
MPKRYKEQGDENIEPQKKKKESRENYKAGRGLPEGVTLTKVEGEDLIIRKIETSKDLIEQPRLAKDERKIIPNLGASVIINGKSGSGKTTLLTNYMTEPQFYGKCPEKPDGWFDEVFLFSPTADGDDIQKALKIKKEHVYTDLDEAPELIKIILDSQKEKLDGGGKAHKVPQYAVIFDDVIGETTFMNTKEFLQTFYMVRHRNCTTFICSQHYKKVPKVCRLQASFIHFFAGSAAEVEQIVDDFAPPLYSRNEFRDIVNEATRGTHSFLTICMKVGWDLRFRRNLDEFISLDRLQSNDDDGPKKGNEPNKKKDQDKKKPKDNKEKKPQICADDNKEFYRNFDTLVKFFKRRHELNEQESPQFRRSQNQSFGGRTF